MSTQDFHERFLKCLPRLLKNAVFTKKVRKDLGEKSDRILGRVRKRLPVDLDDVDYLSDAAWNAYNDCAKVILTLGWDGEHPGGGGGEWLKCCEGVYVITSSDEEERGPFFSLKKALDDDYFNNVAANPELYSDSLPKKKMLEVAEQIVDWQNEGTIRINEKTYRVSGKKLVPDKSEE